MNTTVYNQLLDFSKNLIRKYPNIIVEKEDLVHDAWDFKENDLSVVREKISKIFYRDYIKDVSKVYLAEVKKKQVKINQPDIQCKACNEIKPCDMFSFDKNTNTHASTCKRCKADAQNKLNLQRRLSKTDRILSVHKTLDQLISEIKVSEINKAMHAARNNKSLACKLLKIDRHTFYSIYKEAPKEEINIKPFAETMPKLKKI